MIHPSCILSIIVIETYFIQQIVCMSYFYNSVYRVITRIPSSTNNERGQSPPNRVLQGVRSQGVEKSEVERYSCDTRVWVLPKRQNKMADIILDRQRDYLVKVSHYPMAFICCKQQQRNKLYFLIFVFCFVQFFPRKQIFVLNIVPCP